MILLIWRDRLNVLQSANLAQIVTSENSIFRKNDCNKMKAKKKKQTIHSRHCDTHSDEVR